MRLVVDTPTRAQQLGERALPDQLAARISGQLKKRLVDLDDGAVGGGGQIPARRLLVELFGIVIKQG
jgi:hypothetical protein